MKNVLNAYAIENIIDLQWNVVEYEVNRLDRTRPMKRGDAKKAMWNARLSFKRNCKGLGFIVEESQSSVVVPQEWNIASGTHFDGFEFIRGQEFIVTSGRDRGENAFRAIINDALRLHLKKQKSERLGHLWSDFNSFCQLPSSRTAAGFSFCRRFDCDAKAMPFGWGVRFAVTTAAIDARSIWDYYKQDRVRDLAEMIKAKLSMETRFDNSPAIRVLYRSRNGEQLSVKALELVEPEGIIEDASLPAERQKVRNQNKLLAEQFGQGQIEIEPRNAFLILDSHITREDHDETIISPDERMQFARYLRDHLDGCAAFGSQIKLATTPMSADQFDAVEIAPPAVCVRDDSGPCILDYTTRLTPELLKIRGSERNAMIKEHGFYHRRPIHPLLAIPKQRFNDHYAIRIQQILNKLFDRYKVEYRFGPPLLFDKVTEIDSAVRTKGFNAVLAVLPEHSEKPFSKLDTHDKLKQVLEVPSQCICFNNVQQRAQLSLALNNLLVKAHWFPFVPAQKFHYNTHIGLDVGGKLNNKIVGCIGHGFSFPHNGLYFKASEMKTPRAQAEPIHPDYLYEGLVQILSDTDEQLSLEDDKVNFDTILFLRDGQFLGHKEKKDRSWNELDALQRLFAEAKRRGWVSESAKWTAVEIMKKAEGWRIIGDEKSYQNPMVGYACFPFRNSQEGLLCTTGSPYLSQGTALPLKFKIYDISGQSNRNDVVRELVWEADMCFTKPDMGQSLPWVLHVADVGALHLAQSYQLPGIPA